MLFDDKKIDKVMEKASDMFWSKYDAMLNQIDPKRTLTKTDDGYVYAIPVPGFSKDNITVKNHKETRGLIIDGNIKDSITGTERSIKHNYTYPNGLTVKSVKCLDGILYIFFEDIRKTSTGEEVKID